jgi:PKD repeat protein
MRIKLLYLSVVLLAFLRGNSVSAQALPPIAAFAYDSGIDTIWISSPYRFVNTSSGDNLVYWDVREITGFMLPTQTRTNVPGLGDFIFVGSNHANFDYIFSDTGTYKVKLVVRNNFGIDSVSKIVFVSRPTQKPKANFFIDKLSMGQGEFVPVYDISSNGPTSWQWYVNPMCYSCGNPNVIYNTFLPNPSMKTPNFRATEGGVFDVCLVASNSIGSDTFCQKDYIHIRAGQYMNRNLEDTMTTLNEGYLYDNGGPNASYYNLQGTFPVLNGKTYTLAPCASNITLYIEQFKMRNNDSIILYEAVKGGVQIARLGGTLGPNQSRVLTSTTGKIVFEWKVAAGNTSANDTGFIFRYTSTPATYGAPNAAFDAPEFVYSGTNIKYINQTTGQGNITYLWDADGKDLGNTNPLDDTGFEFDTRDGANWTFVNPGPLPNYPRVCMIATNCKGTSRACRTIEVRPIVTAPVANFYSPRPNGFTTDFFHLEDSSSNGVRDWEWTITPNTFTFQNGTNRNSQAPVLKLNNPGYYTVKLRVRNELGADSIVKNLYLYAINYGNAGTANPIGSGSDIGISRFKFANIDTTTALKTPVYDTLYNRHVALLYRGVEYPMEIHRLSGNSSMTRKVWIDTSLDGDFIDAGELIYSEVNTNNLVANSSFTIPNNIEPGRILRLRVGVSEGASSLSAERAESGCFEDYGIEVGLDIIPPQIWLEGDSVVRVEVNKTFDDPGVRALDNWEGDISQRYESISDIDFGRLGYYTKKYFVKDLYGNVSDTVYRVIQMEINRSGPTLTLNGDDSLFIRVNEDVLTDKIAVPTAVNNLGEPMDSKLIKRFGVVDTAVIGDYKLGWTIMDEFGYTDTVYQNIYVRDVKAPSIWVVGDVNNTRIINHQVGTPYADQAIGYSDDYYVDYTQLILTRTGAVNVNLEGSSVTLKYVVCDPSGNCSEPFYVLVNVKDAVKPTVKLLGENPLKVDVYAEMKNIKSQDPKTEYFDNFYDIDELIEVVDYSKVNPDNIGTYPVTYTVHDPAGNQTVVTRYIQVVDRQAPVIELYGNSTVTMYYNDTFADPGVKIVDNYENDEKLQLSLRKYTTLHVEVSGNDTFFIGDSYGWREIRYNVTDSSGNIAQQQIRRIFVTYRTGLLENKTNGELNVYPNPNKGVFTFSTKEPLKGKTDVSIYNILGAKVFNEVLEETNTTTTHTIKTSGLKPGVYVISVNNNGSQFTQRLVIE